MQVLEATVVAVGPGARTEEGKTIPATVKAGDKVLLPEYGGNKITIDDKVSLLLLPALSSPHQQPQCDLAGLPPVPGNGSHGQVGVIQPATAPESSPPPSIHPRFVLSRNFQ